MTNPFTDDDGNDVCALCEMEYTSKSEISNGTSWADAVGKPPHSLFTEYRAVHAVPTQRGSVMVFLHTEDDMQ